MEHVKSFLFADGLKRKPLPQLREIDNDRPIAPFYIQTLPYSIMLLSLLFLPLNLRRFISLPVIVALIIYPFIFQRQPDAISAYLFGNGQVYALILAGNLLTVDVERTLIRLDKQGNHKPPPKTFIDRAKFYIDLLSNPRGINWEFSRSIDKEMSREESKKSRLQFILSRLPIVFFNILILDGFETYLHTEPYNLLTIRPLSIQPLGMQVLHLILFAFTSYSVINGTNMIASILCVATGISEPKDWPPIFVSFKNAYSIARLWAITWHPIFRRLIMFYGKGASSLVPKRLQLVVKLLVAFSLTGLSHSMGAFVMSGTGKGQFYFFVIQAAGIVGEYMLFGNTFVSNPTTFRKYFGYIYTAIFIGLTSRPFLDEFIESGLCTFDIVPFSITRGILFNQWKVTTSSGRSLINKTDMSDNDDESYRDEESVDENEELSDDFLEEERDESRRIVDEVLNEENDANRLSLFERLLLSATTRSQGLDEDDELDDELDEDDSDYVFFPRVRGERFKQTPSVIQKDGINLSKSGSFDNPNRFQWSNNLTKFARNRFQTFNRFIPYDKIPNTSGTIVSRTSAPTYSGEHSSDGKLFYSADRNFNINIYDPNKPLVSPHSGVDEEYREEHETTMHHIARITGNYSGWTITDCHLSSDNNWLIYSRISPTAHLVNLEAPETQIPLPFLDNGYSDFGYGTGLWSLRFSADNSEIVAGGSDGQIYLYDLNARRCTLRLQAHQNDVNAVAFNDISSNVLISGSDDCVCKIWDRRSLNVARSSGVLIGHTEGITFLSSKNDGRYVASNGKDSSIRIFDLRKMISSIDFDDTTKVTPPYKFSVPGYDYRSSFVPQPKYEKHPQDNSIVTLKGHLVSRTLIRARFSPCGKYIYSGSADGKIYIWSVQGHIVQVIDRRYSNSLARFDEKGEIVPNDPSTPENIRTNHTVNRPPIIRDVSWNPQYGNPYIMSTSWDWDESGSLCYHEYKSLTKMQNNIEDWVEKQYSESLEKNRNQID